MSFEPLQRFRRGLPRGAFWMTGDLLMRFADAIIRCCAVVVPAESQQTNDGIIYNISATAGSGTSASKYALQVYPSEYTGTGTPPSDQGQRGRVRRGTVGRQMPSNIDNEFVFPEGETVLYYEASHNTTTGAVASVLLQLGADVPPDAAGSAGSAPPTSFGAIARVTVTSGTISDIVPDGFGSKSIAVIVSDVDCGKNTLSYFTTPVVEDFTSDEFQLMRAQLDTLLNP